MAARSVIVRLEAEVAGYIAGMGRAGVATDNVARRVVQARRSVADNSAAMEQSGKVLMGFGAASVAALGASTKAAMDWESAWAGVTKTVDGSAEEMDELEAGLRGLAKTLPATHQEIAGVAEAAGQLGVKREDILKFTKTMVDLGETTNLTAEEAATDIAQIANVMGTTGDEIDNFGAALVALGNDGASTEKDILSMAQRIAGAGKLVGASEADVLALSNTLASMGVKAELGGGVATRALLKMYTAVQDGGPKFEAFAATAGVSADAFAKKFESSPVEALALVTKGLGRVKDEGGNVVATLTAMGFKGTEEMQVMLALAGAGDLLTDSLKLGTQAWEENTALIVEATKRYDTTESKVKVAWNNIKDAAIDAGEVMLPVIQGVAESVSGLAQSFGSLPAPVKSAISVLGGVVGVAALLGGATLTLLPKLNNARTAFRDLDAAGSRVPGTLGKIAKAAGLATAAIAGFEIIKGLHNSLQPGTQSAEEFTQALVGLGKQSNSLDNAFANIKFGDGDDLAGQISDSGEALDKLINQDFSSGLASFGSTVLGIDNGMTKLSDAFKKTDQAVAGAATSGNLEIAAKGFKSVADSADKQGISLEEVGKRFPLYLNSLRELASASKVQLSDQELLNWAMGETPSKMEAAAAGGDKAAASLLGEGAAAEAAAVQTKAITEALEEVGLSADGAVSDLEKFTQSLFNAGLLSLSASDGAIAYQAAIDAMTESITNNGKSLDVTTEKGRANQSAYNNIAKSAMAAAEATAAETFATQGSAAAQAVLQTSLSQSYKDLVTAAGQLGITGTAADEMARKALGIPKEIPIETWVNDHATAELIRIKGAADGINGKVVTIFFQTDASGFYDPSAGTDGNGAGSGNKSGPTPRAYAGGGDLDDAPGPKGVDSKLFYGAKGEHVLTAREVDAMGGQDAVYRFRAQVRAGNIPHHAAGGEMGTPGRSAQYTARSSASVATNSQSIAEAVERGLSGWAPMVTIDGRQFHGLLQKNRERR